MAKEIISKIVAKLPHHPGVYKMKDAMGVILYVGKAKDLHKRVSSYFKEGYEHSTRTRKLVSAITDVECIVTDSELEALILETNLIKELRPRYNVLMKDDKSFCYIKVNLDEDYPRIRVVREREKRDSKALYIGPKTASNKVYDTLRIIKKIMPFRHCNLDIAYNGGSNVTVTNKVIDYPCLDYYIKRCPAPCIGAITPDAYKKIIHDIISFLQGKHDEIISTLKERMRALAENKKFEQAARIRDQMIAIEGLSEKQHVDDPRRVDTDIFNYYIEMGRIFINLFMVRGGKLIGQENFVLDTVGITAESDISAEEILSSFLKQYYEKTTDFPKEILIPEPVDEQVVFEQWLSTVAHKKITLTIPQKGSKNTLLLLAKKNAATFAAHYRITWLTEKEDGTALLDLANVLEMEEKKLQRIECFDISHMQGQDTVGSMVVFEKGVPKKDHYRQFKLKTTQGKPDDFSSMSEVLSRRLKYLVDTHDDCVLKKATKKQMGIILKWAKEMGWNEIIENLDLKNFYILHKNKNPIGMVRIYDFGENIFEINSLYIVPEERGKKMSFLLLEQLIGKIKNPRARFYVQAEEELIAQHYAEFGFVTPHVIPDSIQKQKDRYEAIDKKKYHVAAYYKTKQKKDASFTTRPDLLIVDGGKPQLSAAVQALQKLNLTIPVIALAKRKEEIFIPGKDGPLLLEEGESALKLLQRLRDEAHRFAITAHRHLHRKRFQK